MNDVDGINKIKTLLIQDMQRKGFDDITDRITNDHTSDLHNTNQSHTSSEQQSASYITVSNSFQAPVHVSHVSNGSNQKLYAVSCTSNDLITDDEKENNLSY